MPVSPPPRPGTDYSVSRRPTLPVTGRDALTGPTPPPPTSAEWARLRDQTAEMEGLFREALAQQEMRLMARMMERAGAAESAELTMARRSARRRGGIAVALGTALGIATTIFASAWSVIERYRTQTTHEAASAATEAVAPTVAPAIAPLAARVELQDERLAEVDERLSGLERGVSRVLELLEPPTQVRVPRERRR